MVFENYGTGESSSARKKTGQPVTYLEKIPNFHVSNKFFKFPKILSQVELQLF